MITPAYGMTATERVLPRLALDFTTASLDPRVTVTRALNTATVINSSGLVATVNANLPRFDYDPSTLACRGLLIEESRSNAILYSEDFSNGNWAKTGVTIGSNAVVAPDGNTTADNVVEDGSTGLHIAQQFFTFANATAYTFSVFVKPSLRTWVQIFLPTAAFGAAQGGYFNLSGAGSLGNATGTPTSRTITALPNGWYRCTVTATSTAAAGGNVGVAAASANGTNSYAGSNGSTALTLWGADLEVGGFATSYIANLATGSTTRNADQVAMTGTNFSSWYNASEGTLMAEASTFSNAAADKFVANINNNGFPNRILMNFSATNNFSASVVSNSVSQVSGTNGVATTLNTPIKMCFATKLDNFAWSQSGVAPSTDSLGAMPVTVDRLWIGSAFTSTFLNGHMRQIKYWPQRLINAEVQAFSK